MEVEKYTPSSITVGAILGLIASGDIAIPEIQRPFVWKKTQVRDLLDSLYKGFPTGYLIIWKNPDVRLKDGKVSAGKKIMIELTAIIKKNGLKLRLIRSRLFPKIKTQRFSLFRIPVI